MADPWTDALAEAYAHAPLEDVILQTIELQHPSFVTPLRLVADLGDLLSNEEQPTFGHMFTLETDAPLNPGASVPFYACGFAFSMPSQQEGQLPSVSITIDNVGYLITPQLDNLIGNRGKLSIIYREYLNSDHTTPQFILAGLSTSNVSSNITQVSATASFADLVNKNFPSQVYRAKNFPGLV